MVAETAIDGLVELKSASTIDAVYRYWFLHWGIGAWSCYALVGISLAFFSYARGLPLTIGLGLASLSSVLYNINGAEWLIVDGEPSTGSLLVALAVVMVCSTLSALSGVGKGIKWLSNINMALSCGLLPFFLVFGSNMFASSILGKGIFSYLVHLPAMTLNVFPANGAGSPGEWQGWWSILKDPIAKLDCANGKFLQEVQLAA